VFDNDDLIRNAAQYTAGFDRGKLERPPRRRLAVVTCMDARINLFLLLGLREGDAHIIRNAGGVITDGEIRSLAISQRFMGTEEIFLIHHTECGMQAFNDREFRAELEAETGVPVPWDTEAFEDLDLDVLKSIKRIRESPFIPHSDRIRGFVYEVRTGELREVPQPG
jgi:carbonic anhydrase